MRDNMNGMLKSIFGVKKPVIGMIHLLPLPCSPMNNLNLTKITDIALNDAHALEDGGVDGLLVENYGDIPFNKAHVGPHTVSSMTVIAKEISDSVNIPIGINVLRNDAISAIAIAFAVGAKFIRVNVYTGAMITDQGIIEGEAYTIVRYRKNILPDVKIFADVNVKHATPIITEPIVQMAEDTAYRGLADALIITGRSTGKPPIIDNLIKVKKAVPDRPIFIGSGVDIDNIGEFLLHADGIIVGTSFKKEGITTNPVDRERVIGLMNVVNKCR